MRIYADAPHTREVDNDAVVAESASAYVVSASAYSSQEIVVARKCHRGNDICRSGTSGDQRWTFVNVRIPDPACTVIALIVRLKDVT
jgi:predicted DNA binding protein